MNLEEFRKNRKARLENLKEALSNMPELVDDGKAHAEVDATQAEAIKSSNDRDKLVKDSFKDKNKEVKEFVKDQDKDREVDADEKSEKRLILDESLFAEDWDEEEDEPLNESQEILEFVVINSDGTYAGRPCISYEEARELANQQEGREIYKLSPCEE